MKRFFDFLLSPAPRGAIWIWAAAGFVYGALALRLLAVSGFVHGLPQHPTALPYWLFVAAFLGLPVIFPRAGIFIYLGALPVLSSLDVLALGPCWKQHEVALAAFFVGWSLRWVLRGWTVSPKPRVIDFLVGCFALCCALGSIYALAHPSWSNSLSVAFSWVHWPEKTEFNALTMGFSYMSGAFVYASLRVSLGQDEKNAASVVLRLVWIQLILATLLSFGDAFTRTVVYHEKLTRDFFRLPFGEIHNLAGPAIMLAGFFIGATVVARQRARPVKLAFTIAAACAVLLALVSISKAAWVGLIGLTAVAIGLHFGKKICIAIALTGLLLLFVARVLLPPGANAIRHEVVVLTSPSSWSQNATVSDRLNGWMNALLLLMKHPLGGVGVGNFSSMMEHYSVGGFTGTKTWKSYAFPDIGDLDDGLLENTFNSNHAHNDLLEIATGTGIPTAILALVILSAFCIFAARGLSGAKAAPKPMNLIGSGAFFALIGYVFVGLIDSRLTSFTDSVLLGQFAAFALLIGCVEDRRSQELPDIIWPAYLGLAAPASLVLGAVIALAGDALPKDRSFGIWNWHLQEAENVFLLARQAQFVIPPEEKLEVLEFRLPQDADSGPVELRVSVDGVVQYDGSIEKGRPVAVEVSRFRKPRHWPVVAVEAGRWVGRGALGSPLGVKPYAVAMRKIRVSERD